jgi:hypothetical protein
MSLRDAYFNGPNGVQSQMDAAFQAGIAYVGAGVTDASVLDLGDRNGSNLSRGSGVAGAYFTYATPTVIYAFWFSVNGQEIAPTVSNATLIQVDLSNSDSGIQVATKIAAAMNGISGTPFSATSITNIVSMSNNTAGVVVTPIAIGTLDYTPAAFSGTITGTSTPVVLTANFAGPNGANIVLTFSGSNTISQAITTWNTANPLNSVSLTSGNGTQMPSAGTQGLSGGDAGTAVVTQVTVGVTPTGNYTTLQSALVAAAAQGLSDFRVLVQGTGTGNATYLRYRNGHNMYLGAFFAGISYALADQNIYEYQCDLTLDISMNSSTNVIFGFHFGGNVRQERVNLEPLTSSQFNPNNLGFASGVLPI